MKLQKVLLSAVAAFALAATATSARAGGSINDVRPFSWTGFYVGGHLGAAWADVDWTLEFVFNEASDNRRVSQRDSNVVGGGQIGVQYQFRNVVAGVEVSFSGTSLSDKTVAPVSGVDRTFTSNVEKLFMAVGRVGLAHDNWLAYFKGGYAAARVDLDASLASNNQPVSSSSKWQNGYVLGAGFEYAVGKNVSLGLEYNYVNLGSFDALNVTRPEVDLGSFNHRDIDTTISSVVARINIKLDREREPLGPVGRAGGA